MRFTTRAVIALLAAVGAGTVGFWAAWRLDQRILFLDQSPVRDALFLGSIFGPGVLAAVLVFRSITLATAPRRA
jgi:hypothetical protein